MDAFALMQDRENKNSSSFSVKNFAERSAKFSFKDINIGNFSFFIKQLALRRDFVQKATGSNIWQNDDTWENVAWRKWWNFKKTCELP